MKIVSPAGLAASALVLAVLYGVAHLAGMREDTTILSGSAPPGGGSADVAAGVVYILLHFAFVIGAPILALAAGIFWALARRGGITSHHRRSGLNQRA
jgi:hypothetical protein